MFNKKTKRLAAISAIVLGIAFVIFALLGIWKVIDFVHNEMMTKLMTTLGLLTASFIVLLIIIKLTEEKQQT